MSDRRPAPAHGLAREARRLALVWLALLALMLASLGSAYVPLGLGNVVAGLAIAGVKAGLVIACFMRLGRAPAITRLAGLIRARASDDLRPLPGSDLPSDIRPLVDAVNQQMQRTERLVREREGFIDDASHQLRTPLATLRAQLDYVLRETDPQRRGEAL